VSISERQSGKNKVTRDATTDTIRAAKQHSPTNHLIFCNDNEDDLRGLAPLFIKQQIQLLSALMEAQKARRDQLRKAVGPPTTALDLKWITQKYLLSAVDRDEDTFGVMKIWADCLREFSKVTCTITKNSIRRLSACKGTLRFLTLTTMKRKT
jgi:hypothetical protein